MTCLKIFELAAWLRALLLLASSKQGQVLMLIEFVNCIPENFNTNISHQLFDYTITFVNSQHWNTNSKGDFVLKTRF